MKRLKIDFKLLNLRERQYGKFFRCFNVNCSSNCVRVFQSSPSLNPLFFCCTIQAAVIINKSRRSIHNRVQCIYYFLFYFSTIHACVVVLFLRCCWCIFLRFFLRVFHYSLLHCSILLNCSMRFFRFFSVDHVCPFFASVLLLRCRCLLFPTAHICCCKYRYIACSPKQLL